jgi:D-threonate/D-erythronate kinase
VTLFVCGSASDYARQLASRAAKEGVSVCAMPDDVFREPPAPMAGHEAVERWASSVGVALESNGRALVAIHRPLARKSDAPQRLQGAMADVVKRVLDATKVDNLLAAGGATASAVCERMNWHQFEVNGELASGVVQMRVLAPGAQRLIIKPGSYPWPDLVWKKRG